MDAIIQPRRGRTSPRLGPVAVLAATEPDLGLLRRALGFDADSGRRLYISKLFTASDSHPALSLSGPMVGAPYAVMVAETLIAWGARTLVFLGWCGAVSKPAGIGDLVLPTAAFIDEGTSRHYLADADRSAPSASLAHQLAEACPPAEIPLHHGPVWTTDAPFRETREKVMDFQRRGALAVEMECSALFTLAAFRSVPAAALLVVSDDLSDLSWKAGFKDPRFSRSREAAGGIVGRLCSRLLSPAKTSAKP
jgi:purine-nucleoside phosphorylase